MALPLISRTSLGDAVRTRTNGHTTAAPQNLPPALPDDFWQIDEAAVLHPPADCFYEIVVDTFFNARHAVVIAGRQGPIHAHSYRLQVRCRSWALETEDQVVVGYQPLRERMKQVVQAYNNRLLNDLPPFQRLQPTTENLAAVLFQQLQQMLGALPVELVSITVWESPTEAITYRRERGATTSVPSNGHAAE